MSNIKGKPILAQMFIYGVHPDTVIPPWCWCIVVMWLLALFGGVAYVGESMCLGMANSRNRDPVKMCGVSSSDKRIIRVDK